jgi:hypothetical protein
LGGCGEAVRRCPQTRHPGKWWDIAWGPNTSCRKPRASLVCPGSVVHRQLSTDCLSIPGLLKPCSAVLSFIHFFMVLFVQLPFCCLHFSVILQSVLQMVHYR